LYLDNDRRSFCAELARLVADLDACKISGNSHNIFVVGPKGTGKSCFLQAFVAATQLVADHTLAVYLGIKSLGTSKSLVDHVADVWLQVYGEVIPLSIDRTQQVKDLLETLAKRCELHPHGRQLVLVIDEYHTLYSEDTPENQSCLAQASSLVKSIVGSTLIVVAGDSVCLREFGNKSALSSLMGRTNVRMLGPIVCRDDLRDYLNSIGTDVSKHIARSDSELDSLFLATGGIRQTIDEYLFAWQSKDSEGCAGHVYSTKA